jgi:glutamine amidotransferase
MQMMHFCQVQKGSCREKDMKKIAIIDYGAGNLHSVMYALERLGVHPIITDNKSVLTTADLVIFPGVGHAQSAMEALRAKGLTDFIPTLKQPVLGICLGMQLMCRHTEEGDVDGLGIFDVDVLRFKGDFKVPHMGWNRLLEGQSILENIENDVYFVHSYYVPVVLETIAITDYHGTFSAALQKDNFYACQFHPEKSGVSGEQILRNFLKK